MELFTAASGFTSIIILCGLYILTTELRKETLGIEDIATQKTFWESSF